MATTWRTSQLAGALALLAAVIALTPPAVCAQTSPPPHAPVLQTPASRSAGESTAKASEAAPAPAATKQINLLAFVHDKKGRPVSNLTKQDFVLEQDGHAQTITQVAEEASAPLVIGLVAETAVGQQKALGNERKAGAEFFKNLREGNDRGFVLHFDREVELLQDVTASHDKLAQAINEIAADNKPHGPPPRHKRNDSEPGQHFTFGGEVLYDAIFLSADEVLKGEPGRKAIVVFSAGADESSKTNLRKAIEAAQHAGVIVYCVYVEDRKEEERADQSGPQGYPGGGYPGGGYPPGYPGGGYPQPYPGGGYPPGYPGGSPWPRRREPESTPRVNKEAAKKTLQQIANETGGRFFDLSKISAAHIFAEIQDDLHHPYRLTYTPDPAASGYHKLHVSARNPELTVQAPSGFYAE